VAHDADNWYVASQYGLWKLPVDHPLDDHDAGWMRNVPIPPELWSRGYNHFGDPEFSGGALYVPLEGSGVPRVLVYDPSLNLMADAVKRAPTPNAKGIIEALDGTENFHGVSGTISLKGHQGNPPKRALVVEVTASGIKFRKSYEHFE
jgi:hypothetical protein